MSAEPGPIDCLQRGLRSLRANWQVVPLLAVQTVLTIALTLAGFFVLLAGLGVSVVSWLRGLGPDWPRQLTDALVAGLEAAPPPMISLLTPLVAASLLWTLAFGLYCYLQGGVVGVLAEGEAAAGAGLPGWRSFRTFSGGGFDRHGRRLFWRYFWLAHLAGAVALVWLLPVLLLVALAARLAASPDIGLGIAVGCFGLVPLALALFAISLWVMLATVEVARPGTGVWRASRRAVATLRRRLGGVLLIWLLALAGWMMLGALFAPIRWGIAYASADSLALWLAARGTLVLAETLANSALAVVLLATLAAFLGLGGAAAGREAAT